MAFTLTKALPALAVAAILAPASAQEIDLSYNWQAGDTLTYAMTNESTQDQVAMGNETSTSMTSEQVVSIEVLEVADNGNSTIRQTVDSIKLTITQPGGVEMSYDSEAESNASASNPTVASMAALDGAEYTIVLAPDGSVVGLPDYEQWKQEAMSDASPERKRMLASAPDKKTLMQNIEGTYRALAGKTVSQGDTWSTEMRNEFGPGAVMTFTFDNTVASVTTRSGDKQADIKTEGKIDLTAPENTPMELKIKEQTITGQSTYSSDKGVIVSSQGAMQMVMTGGMPGSEPMMTMTMNQKSEMKLVSFERGG